MRILLIEDDCGIRSLKQGLFSLGAVRKPVDAESELFQSDL